MRARSEPRAAARETGDIGFQVWFQPVSVFAFCLGRSLSEVTRGSLTKQIRLVVTVKSYPQPSSRYHESVCVAGIRTDTSDPKWVRIYPVQFRDLPEEKQFPKWSEIELEVTDSSSDNRPETLRPIESSIEVVRRIGTSANWAERMQFLDPLLVDSMCDVVRQQRATGASLRRFGRTRSLLLKSRPRGLLTGVTRTGTPWPNAISGRRTNESWRRFL